MLKDGEGMIDQQVFPKPYLSAFTAVTPGITAGEYARRRSKLVSKLPADGIAIVAAADVKYRSGAVFYDFHQESNFFYLTGIACRSVKGRSWLNVLRIQ